MPKTRRETAASTKTLQGRNYQPGRVDFLTRPYMQRIEDRVRGGRGGRAEGEGFAFETGAGEQPAHATIDAHRDRALTQAEAAFEQPRANAINTRDLAVQAKQDAERERDRLRQLRATRHADLIGLEARDAA